MTAPPSAWGVLGNSSPIHEDLHHAIAHAAPDEPVEDAEGFVTWNGRGRDAATWTPSQEDA